MNIIIINMPKDNNKEKPIKVKPDKNPEDDHGIKVKKAKSQGQGGNSPGTKEPKNEVKKEKK